MSDAWRISDARNMDQVLFIICSDQLRKQKKLQINTQNPSECSDKVRNYPVRP